MQDQSANLTKLRARMAGIGAQLDGDWSERLNSQLHLDRETRECAYWHAGYYQALADVLAMTAQPRATVDISDTSSPLLAAG
jgi:hypothetical protein